MKVTSVTFADVDKGNYKMSKAKIFFVVGHANWGKTETLKALTNGASPKTKFTIAGVEYFIRRTSNDDASESYIKMMGNVKPEEKPNLIAALCPEFENPKRGTIKVLQHLKAQGYKLFFWVLEEGYKSGDRITKKEISALKKFGKVEVLGQSLEALGRARKLKAFIVANQ